MREILFRGQTRKRGEKVLAGSGENLPGIWVYGGIFPQNKGGSYSIIYTYDPIDKKIVYADTVGQYTGLTDKNGVRIFEGDIARYDDELVVVEWAEDAAMFVVRAFYGGVLTDFSQIWGADIDVIGNAHDNPELLEVEK